MSVDLTQYKVGVIQTLKDCGNCKGGGKALRSLKIQIADGDDDECFITVVTSANNVRENLRYDLFVSLVYLEIGYMSIVFHSLIYSFQFFHLHKYFQCFIFFRVVVAPAGSSVLDNEGELLLVKKASVGGVTSEGMLCDSYMLNWKGGGKGIAATLPDHFEIGSVPPDSKPRGKEGEANKDDEIAPAAPGLYEKKLTKEEKKKLAEEKRRARRAAKEAKAAAKEAEGKRYKLICYLELLFFKWSSGAFTQLD